MGYTTDFDGQFNLDKPLEQKHADYLKKFAETRRMKRDRLKVAERPDPLREAVGLPVGYEGGYFVGALGMCGQENSADIVDSNKPPKGQPGLWCQWIPTDDNLGICWDEGEKFYSYVEWIQYLIQNFLAPWGYTLNGEVGWTGENRSDVGLIRITNNRVEALEGKIVYE